MFLILVALALGIVNVFLILGLWLMMRDQGQLLQQIQAAVLRQGREMAQQRYAIVKIKERLKNPESIDLNATPRMMKAVKDAPILSKEEEREAKTVPVEEFGVDIDLDKLKDKDILEFIKNCVRHNSIALAQQPIIGLRDNEIAFYEIFSRIKTLKLGYLPAQKFIDIARNNNLISNIDSLLLMRSLQVLKDRAEKQERADFFMNVSVQTLTNKEYLYKLVEFLKSNPELAARLVFEMTQDDWRKVPHSVQNIQNGLALLGCRFSMDKVTMLGMDPDRLNRQNITFIKLDMKTVQNEIAKSGNNDRIKRLKNNLATRNIHIIIEKVEDEKQSALLQAIPADYGQGYLFGAPVVMD